jgi:hypothetical protein
VHPQHRNSPFVFLFRTPYRVPLLCSLGRGVPSVYRMPYDGLQDGNRNGMYIYRGAGDGLDANLGSYLARVCPARLRHRQAYPGLPEFEITDKVG